MGRTEEARTMYQESLGLLDKASAISKSPTYEIIIPAARHHLKLGKIQQAVRTECPSAETQFKSGYDLLQAFKQKDRLSPTNESLYRELKTLAESPGCK